MMLHDYQSDLRQSGGRLAMVTDHQVVQAIAWLTAVVPHGGRSQEPSVRSASARMEPSGARWRTTN